MRVSPSRQAAPGIRTVHRLTCHLLVCPAADTGPLGQRRGLHSSQHSRAARAWSQYLVGGGGVTQGARAEAAHGAGLASHQHTLSLGVKLRVVNKAAALRCGPGRER